MRAHVRTFLQAMRLGWQVESNWTQPGLFLAFSLLKPLSGALILVFMYRSIGQRQVSEPLYAALYLGYTFYLYVGATLAGVSYTVLDDRERYQTLKYLYIAPLSIPVYLLGRAAARGVVATVAVCLLLGVGVGVLDVPLVFTARGALLFLAAMGLGLTSLACLGMALGMWTLTVRSAPWYVGDSVAATLYLFSGATIPLAMLPPALRWIGLVLPLASWQELVRRGLLGSRAAAFAPLDQLSDTALLGQLALLTLGCGALAWLAFHLCDRKVREAGLLEPQGMD